MGHRSPDIDAYIENAAPEHREALEALRSIIHAIHPDIVETIAYKMPTFTLDGEMIAGLASRARYISLYCKPEVVDAHREALGKLNVGKGCIRFQKLDELPMPTIEAILLQSHPA